MRNVSYKIFLIICFVGILDRAIADTKIIQQITTHPAEDIHPAVSMDGKWLAFVSDRNGSRDIWIKPLPHGKAVQITTNPSEDCQPVWASDGRSILFVSKRSDVRGDLWIIKIKRGRPYGKPIQVTSYQGVDSQPDFSPDGSKIVYVSDRNNGKNLWIKNINTNKSLQITFKGASEPAWSPDGRSILFTSFRNNMKGDLFILQLNNTVAETGRYRIVSFTSGESIDCLGKWLRNSKTIVFQRYHRDCDGDGRITPLDNGSVWRKNVFIDNFGDKKIFYNPEIQLTAGIYNDSYPCISDSAEILFCSDRGGGRDIWSIPDQGLFPKEKNGIEQYLKIMDLSAEKVTKEELRQVILGYQRVLDFFPFDSLWAARSMLQMGELFRITEDHRRAAELFGRIKYEYPRQKEEIAAASLKDAVLNIYTSEEKIDKCRSVIETFSENHFIAAQAWIQLGELYESAGKRSKSLSSFNHVIESYPEFKNIQPLARLKIGDIFRSAEQPEAARQNYLSVLRDYKDVPLWRKRAAERILLNISMSTDKQIPKLREVIHQADDIPSLQAEAHLQICNNLIKNENYEQAIKELLKVKKLFPGLRWALVRSKIMLADAFNRFGDELKSFYLLYEIIEKYSTIEGGRFVYEAEEKLFHMLMNSASKLLKIGDYKLALARFYSAAEIKPSDIKVYRGMVEAAYRSGKIISLIKEFERDLSQDPENPVLLYGLGLSLSFSGEKNIEILKRSNLFLQQALDVDYSLVYPYRTLSFNYELIEELDKNKQSNQSFLSNFWNICSSPFRWVAGLLPFGEEKQEVRYYEKAIEALITALELNNEKKYPDMEALLAQNLANNFYHLGEFGYKKASQYYRMRLSIDTTFSNSLEKAVFYERLGHCEAVLLDRDAETDLNKSINCFQKLQRNKDVERNRRLLAFHYNLIKEYEKAISIYIELTSNDRAVENTRELQRDYRNIAYNFYLLEEYKDCLKFARKSEKLLLREDISIKPLKKNSLRIEMFGFSIPIWSMAEIGGASSEGFSMADEMAFVYSLISKSCESLKSFHTSVKYENKRLEIFGKRKDAFATRICLNRIGILNYKLLNFKAAWNYFTRSLKMCKMQKDSRGIFINGVNLGNIATVYQEHFNDNRYFDSAEKILSQNLKSAELNTGELQLRDRIVLYNTLGTLWTLKAKTWQINNRNREESITAAVMMMKNLQNAEEFFLKALAVARKYRLKKSEGIVLKNFAEIARLLKNNRDALKYLNDSREIFKMCGEYSLMWRVLYSIAGIIDDVPDQQRPDFFRSKTSSEIYLQAINELEKTPVLEERSSEKISDKKERWDIYTDCAFNMVKQGSVRKALEIIERGREKQIADVLAKNPPDFRKERHKLIWGNVKYIKSRLNGIQKQIYEKESQQIENGLLKELEDEKKKLEEEFKQILKNMHDEDPVLAYLAGAEPVDIKKIQNLIDKDEAAICYLLGKSKSLVWVVDQDTVLSEPVSSGKERINKLIKELGRRIHADTLTSEISKELYDILLQPVEHLLKKKSKLIVIPDDTMWSLPFEMLEESGRMSLEKFAIHYTPSLTEYGLSYERRKVNQKRIVCAGELQDRGFFNSLKETVRTQTILLGKEASEPEFLANINNADIIHPETWMFISNAGPLASALVLNQGQGADGYLRAEEIFSKDLSASLFVLPCLASQMDTAFLPLRIFIESLLYSGVPSVQLNCWRIRDEVKKQFYGKFYSEIGKFSEAEAFRIAKAAVKEKYPSAKDWAGFRYIGFKGMDIDQSRKFSENNLLNMVQKGRIFTNGGNYDEAIKVLEHAFEMTEIMQDSVSRQRVTTLLVWSAAKGRRWAKAAFYQKIKYEAVKSENDISKLIKAGNSLAAFYFQDRQFENAATVKKDIINVNQRSGSEHDLASLYKSLSLIYSSSQNYDRSVHWMNMALEVYRNENKRSDQAESLIWLGRFKLEEDVYTDGLNYIDKGIDLLKNTSLQKNKFQLASGYQLKGLIYERLTQYKKAMEYQEKALLLFQQLKHPMQTAQGHQYMANLFWKTGNYREAVSAQERALIKFKKYGKIKQLVMGYSTLGLIKMSLGETAEALKHEQTALKLAQKDLNLKADEASILKNVGLIMIQNKDYDRALDNFKKAAEIDSAVGSQRGLAYDYRNQGVVMVNLNKIKQGIKLLVKGLALSRQLGDLRNEVRCLYGLANAYKRKGKSFNALAYADTTAALISNLLLPEQEWRLHHLKGRIFAETGRDEEALVSYSRSIEIVEQMRSELQVESFKQGFTDKRIDIYTDIINHLLKMKRYGEAFNYAERAKSRNFIDMLSHGRIDLSGTESELLKQEESARKDIDEARRLVESLSKQRNRSKEAEEKYTSWKTELEKRKKNYNQILTSIQSESSQLASFVSVDPWSLQKIRSMLPDSVMILEYYLTEDRLLCWAVMKDRLYLKTINIQKSKIIEMVTFFRRQIGNYLSAETESRLLYDCLIKSIEKYLDSVNHIVVIPHGPLHYVPFSGLLDKDEIFLIEKVSISYAPSSTVLGYCLNKKRSYSRLQGNRTVLAFSNPDLKNDKSDLPFAEKEVVSLKRAYNNIKVFNGAEATENAVRNSIADHYIIHFACHATYDPVAPLFSSLLLAPEKENNGRLEAHEIFGLKLKCDLVTLSGCKTGMAKISSGDEMIGLARSFIYAGTPSIITSLWSIDDLATAVLIKRFYRYLSAGYSKPVAMQKAQLLVKDRVNNHLAAWAAFKLTGDFR